MADRRNNGSTPRAVGNSDSVAVSQDEREGSGDTQRLTCRARQGGSYVA